MNPTQPTLTADQRQRAEDNLRRGRLKLLESQPFLAYGAMKLTLVADDSIPTLCTDGQKIWFNPAYVWLTEMPGAQNYDMAVSEVSHETLHAIFGHCRDWVAQGYNVMVVGPDGSSMPLANIAQDYVVNLHLKDMGFHIHPTWCCDEKYRGMSWFEVYDELVKNNPPKGTIATCKVHAQPPAVPPADSQAGTGKPEGKPEKGDGDLGAGFEAVDSDGKPFNAWDRIVVEAARFASGMGKVPDFAKKLVEQIERPVLHWTAYVARYIRRVRKGEYSFVRPNKRYLHKGMVLPGTVTRTGEVIVGLDTSGSCWNLMPKFLSELWGIAKAVKVEVDVIECDTNPRAWRLKSPDDVKRVAHMGGGGTDFRPVFEAIRTGTCPGLERDANRRVQRPELLIFITDGEGTYPEVAPPYPVLWCIPNSKNLSGAFRPPFGIVVDLPIK